MIKKMFKYFLRRRSVLHSIFYLITDLTIHIKTIICIDCSSVQIVAACLSEVTSKVQAEMSQHEIIRIHYLAWSSVSTH